MTALRFALREPRTWENQQRGDNAEYRVWFRVPEHDGDLGTELAKLMDPDELAYVLARKNRAAHLIAGQHLREGVDVDFHPRRSLLVPLEEPQRR